MPDFAPTYTARYQLVYIAAGVQHTMQFRFARGSSGASIVTAGHSHANALFTALAASMADDLTFISAQWAAEDSTVFTPAGSVPTAVVGTVDVADFSPTAKVTALHFPGKSTVSKAGVFLYGSFRDPYNTASFNQDSRVTSAEDSSIAAAIASLGGGTSIVAINNIPASWYPYATIKLNDHLLKLVRKGTIS